MNLSDIKLKIPFFRYVFCFLLLIDSYHIPSEFLSFRDLILKEDLKIRLRALIVFDF